jgi:hypothetical protein
MRHDFEGGKYTVEFDEQKGTLVALRYGEPWRELVGDKLVLVMLQEVDALREEVGRLRQAQQPQQMPKLQQPARGPALGPVQAHSPERSPGSALPASVGPDVDLTRLGGDIASMLVQRTRELWGLAMADFDRGLSQLERMHGAVVVPSAAHDRSAHDRPAHAGQSTAQPVQEGIEETAEEGAEEGPGSAAMPQALRHR